MDFLRQLRAGLGRQGAPADAGTTGENVRITNPWHAVSIVPKAGACASARSIAGKRFLSSEDPPPLPLKDCTAASCSCCYAHHSDRRARRREDPRTPGSSAHPQRRADD
jgi:hypothetical protein